MNIPVSLLPPSGDDKTSTQALLDLYQMKTNPECHELILTLPNDDNNYDDQDQEDAFVTSLIDVLHSKDHWEIVEITEGGNSRISSDILWAICSCTIPIARVSIQCRGSRHRVLLGLEQQQQQHHFNSVHTAAITYGLTFGKEWKALKLNIPIISVDACNAWARAIARSSSLRTLDLGGSMIAVGRAAIGPLSFGLRLNSSLEELRLDSCALDDSEMATILQAIHGHLRLKILCISQNQCHDEGMAAIAGILHYNTALEELDMSYLVRKRRDQTTAASTTTPEPAAAEETELNNDDGSGQQQDTTEEETKNELNDADNNDDEGVQAKKEEESDHTPNKEEERNDHSNSNKVVNLTLKRFHMAGNFLNDDFLSSVLGVFGNGSTLEELNLFGNRLSDAGLDMIIRRLQSDLRHVNTLWLGQNAFTANAGKRFLEAMKDNFTLLDVNLRCLDNPPLNAIQDQIDFYCGLNRYGRRILANSSNDRNIPNSLWSKILEFPMVHRRLSEESTSNKPMDGDVIYTILRHSSLLSLIVEMH